MPSSLKHGCIILHTGVEDFLSSQRRNSRGEEDEEEEGDGEGASPSEKRQKTLDPVELQRRRDELLNYYSEKSGFGKPSALLLYHLACKTGKDKPMSLWWVTRCGGIFDGGWLGVLQQLFHAAAIRR